MKKLLPYTLIVLTICMVNSASAAILTTETKTKLANYKDQIFAIYPNTEQTCDENGENCVAKYTDSEWIDEIVKDFLILQIKTGQAVIYRDAFTATEPTIE